MGLEATTHPGGSIDTEDDDEGSDTWDDLCAQFDAFSVEFRAFFEAERAYERSAAATLFGHHPDDPMLHSHETQQDVANALAVDTMTKLETFGYRRVGPRRMMYWLDKRSGIADLLFSKDATIDVQHMPVELFNHVYVHHVHLKRMRTIAKARTTRALKLSRPRLLHPQGRVF